jgi:carbon monoxide dehydrogenase subunit G
LIAIENDFAVPASPSAVYDLLIDLEQVGGCIPGGNVGPQGDDGSHAAEVVVKLGPMRFNYRGTVRLVDREETDRRAALTADLREARGQGAAKARMEMSVQAEDNGSRVVTHTEVQLTGRAAQMGRGVIDDVAGRMVEDMAACVTQRLRATETAPRAEQRPIGGLRLVARVLWARLGRLFSRSRDRRQS